MKPHCIFSHLLLFCIIHSTLFISLALCRKSSSPEHDCLDDLVYVDQQTAVELAGCYPKVRLGRECTFSPQCSSLNANAHCGFNPSFTGNQVLKVCLCNEGYSNSPDSQYECLPVRNCTSGGGNAHHDSRDFEQQADCGEWQFCRQGACHCKADLAFNESGHCVPVQQGGFNKKNADVVNSCSEEQIFVREPANRKGCYPAVKLLEECLFSGQCILSSEGDANATAFCGWSPRLNAKNPVCLCADGYKPEEYSIEDQPLRPSCIPIQQCTLSGFNVGLEAANCGPEQFCRNNLCLCKPDYEYDPRKGECVKQLIWDYGDGEDGDEDEDDGYNVEPAKPKRWYNKPAWIVLIVALLALIFFLGYAVLLYHTRKEEDRLEKKSRLRDSGDHYDKEDLEEDEEVSQKLKNDVSEGDKMSKESDLKENRLSEHKMYFESEV